MSDAKSTSPDNSQNQTLRLEPAQLAAIVDAMLPKMESLIRSAMSDTMTVEDFAATRGISERLVWQWLDKGILLKAPTKDFSNKEEANKRCRTLINVKAWRDKLTQQAIDCRYIPADTQALN
ncbi:Cro/Cl family transcriptional regulator [Salmonella enterica]|nr:Cro/Cl family transcriptional regulator [Salmonella enterica]ECC3553106.1 Cro/Cl family transcriptional regulator [Salmonella enterica subsp. salamae]ECD2130220.1 Cro/Cl family transcriptional regulator [Salmonella enterica subsp. enterica serovar Senftenberg]HAW4270635.1 Cro/Cl family transcriptional regulator [Escherichia coli]HED1354614.1 Cro/Cl family transcriptional regulator [Citrobacter werkmanii]